MQNVDEQRARQSASSLDSAFSSHSAFSIRHYLQHYTVAASLALLFLVFHLRYLPASLEDLDSINFALGVRHFDVAQHQPHPPGYPLFIVAAKAAHALIPSEAHALAAVSIAGGSLGVLAIAALFRHLEPPGITNGDRNWWPLVATAVAITAPMYWFTAARPLSDAAGLAAAVAVQVVILRANTPRELYVAAFLAAFVVGLRSQLVWLTLPLLVLRTSEMGAGDWGLEKLGFRNARQRATGNRQPATNPQPAAPSPQALVPMLFYIAGVLAWLVPLVVVSGGPRAYWRALFNQGAEDFSGVRMLWTTPTARQLIDALYYAFVAPWAVWWLATAVLALAMVGVVRLWLRDRRVLMLVAVSFGPYLLFDLVFQESVTSRYALPLAIPLAYLAASGARAVPASAGLAIAIGVAVLGAHAGGTSVAAFSRQRAPAFRLIDDLRTQGAAPGSAAILAMDRRESLDLRRPIVWIGGVTPPFADQLPAPAQHEWLQLVRYWNGGGRSPVVFVADPKRTDIDLVQHPPASQYRWNLPYPVLIDGVRPNEMDSYAIASPDWYVGEGWALTPEAAGVSARDRRGLDAGPIDAWIAHRTGGGALMIGGRNFEPAANRALTLELDGRPYGEWFVAPGFFLHTLKLPSFGGADFVKVTVRTTPPARVAIEQFDASTTRALLGFGDGWNEQEYSPQTGQRWRWLTERGELRVHAPAAAPATLHIEGESPRKYYPRASRLVVRAGDRIVLDREVATDFALDVPVPLAQGDQTIVLETNQIHVPAERSRRTLDRRHLGLRIWNCRLTF